MKKSIMILLCVAMTIILGTTAVFASQGTQNEKITYRSISIVIDGSEIAPCDVNGTSTEPFIRNADGSTYLPVRAVAGALGLKVDWDDASNTVILNDGGTKSTGAQKAVKTNVEKTAALTYRDIKITLNGKTVALVNVNGDPVEPFIKDGSTYIPVRAVASALGCEISWNGDTSTVYVSSMKNPAEGITNEEACNLVYDYCLNHSPNVSYELPETFPEEATFYAGEDSCTVEYVSDKDNTCLVSAGFYDAAAIFWVDKTTGEFKYICDTQEAVEYLVKDGYIDMANGNTSGPIADGGIIDFNKDFSVETLCGHWEATTVYFLESQQEMSAKEYFGGTYSMDLCIDTFYDYYFNKDGDITKDSGKWVITNDGMKFDGSSKMNFVLNSYGNLELPIENGILTFKKID